ncbi:MAG: hypothetical protein QM610_07105 [Chitinophagaceae bacterium]
MKGFTIPNATGHVFCFLLFILTSHYPGMANHHQQDCFFPRLPLAISFLGQGLVRLSQGSNGAKIAISPLKKIPMLHSYDLTAFFRRFADNNFWIDDIPK